MKTGTGDSRIPKHVEIWNGGGGVGSGIPKPLEIWNLGGGGREGSQNLI